MYNGLVFWGEGGCDQAFAERVLCSGKKLAEIEADFATEARSRSRAALNGYMQFVKQQQQLPPPRNFFGAAPAAPAEPVKWPAWRLQKHSDSLLFPSVANIRTTLIEFHKIYAPLLLGDLVRRSPGRGASSDGTFRLMARTNTDGKVRCSPPFLPCDASHTLLSRASSALHGATPLLATLLCTLPSALICTTAYLHLYFKCVGAVPHHWR